jgi:hypothetical protein
MVQLLGDTLMPSETRATIINGWDNMKANERRALIKKLRKERDPLKRVLIAVWDTTKVLLTRPTDEIQITQI